MPQTSKRTGEPILPKAINNARDDKVRTSAFWRVAPPVRETSVCSYAAMGWLSSWLRLNRAGERWPWRSISQCSL